MKKYILFLMLSFMASLNALSNTNMLGPLDSMSSMVSMDHVDHVNNMVSMDRIVSLIIDDQYSPMYPSPIQVNIVRFLPSLALSFYAMAPRIVNRPLDKVYVPLLNP